MPSADLSEGLARGFDESVDIIAADLADILVTELKPRLRKQKRVWKEALNKLDHGDGCHDAARFLRQSFREMAGDALAGVDLSKRARQAWALSAKAMYIS